MEVTIKVKDKNGKIIEITREMPDLEEFGIVNEVENLMTTINTDLLNELSREILIDKQLDVENKDILKKTEE